MVIVTVQNFLFCIKYFFSKCDQIHSFLKLSLMDNLIFRAVDDDNVRFFMTKTLIIVIMKELVIITIAAVIKSTYRRNSMEKKKQQKQTNKQLDLIKKLVR